jgi:hypothetical protein
VAATKQVVGLLGGVLAAGGAAATDLPEDRAEAMYHVYDGGGVTAKGPALLVRKSLADKVSLSASYYVDAVSNASIDVVTTASPFKETRKAYDLGADYVVRDTLMSLSVYKSDEPDYQADSVGVDVAQEIFGGMTTVSLGYSRGLDQVGKKDQGFFDTARHWNYRLGVTQILTPAWLMSVNAEGIADEGFLGSPYRVARVFGAAVPERNPRTRSSRAVKLRVIGDIGERRSVRAEYRYFWDTWDVHAHTAEVGHSRYIDLPGAVPGDKKLLLDGFLRYYTQTGALFYSDNATSETEFVSRNRQLSRFNSLSLGGRLSYTLAQVPGQYEIKANGAYEFKRFDYKDFTDLRTGSPFAFNAHLLQVYVSATF